ncbi:hypothetical protein DM992_17065 [Burkholderia sp. JP2-270]|nr:hypothetical protein DM992_17065 [Burkholderia sp. JP2-270]
MLDVRAPWRRRPSGNARHVPVARTHARRACAALCRGVGVVRMMRRAARAVRRGAGSRAQMVHGRASPFRCLHALPERRDGMRYGRYG